MLCISYSMDGARWSAMGGTIHLHILGDFSGGIVWAFADCSSLRPRVWPTDVPVIDLTNEDEEMPSSYSERDGPRMRPPLFANAHNHIPSSSHGLILDPTFASSIALPSKHPRDSHYHTNNMSNPGRSSKRPRLENGASSSAETDRADRNKRIEKSVKRIVMPQIQHSLGKFQSNQNVTQEIYRQVCRSLWR
jgi:hypothetical protein